MDSAPPQARPNGAPRSADELPPEAIALATRMFDAARKGDERSVALLTQALGRGLPANLTNDKGDSLVGHSFPLPYISLSSRSALLYSQ